MNTISRTARFAAAAIATATTIAIFSAVTSIAGPERNVLMAKIEHNEQVASAQANARSMAAASSALMVASSQRR